MGVCLGPRTAGSVTKPGSIAVPESSSSEQVAIKIHQQLPPKGPAMTAYPTPDEELAMLKRATPGSFFCYLANQPVTITGDPVGLVVELIDNPSGAGEMGSEVVLVLADHSRDGLEEGVYFFEVMVIHDHGGYDTPGQMMLTSHAQVRRSRDLSNNPAVAAAAKRIVDHLTEAK